MEQRDALAEDLCVDGLQERRVQDACQVEAESLGLGGGAAIVGHDDARRQIVLDLVQKFAVGVDLDEVPEGSGQGVGARPGYGREISQSVRGNPGRIWA